VLTIIKGVFLNGLILVLRYLQRKPLPPQPVVAPGSIAAK
jgi:hypothetical protein